MNEFKETAGQPSFRILVVDDNKDAADSLSRLLKLWGFEVRAVYDGAEAIEAARAYLPDCIVTDIGLPGIDGYVLAERVRRDPALQKTILIAITAYSDVKKAKAAGFDRHFVKPADPFLVERTLRELQSMAKRLERTEQLVVKQGEAVAESKELMKEVKEKMEGVTEGMQEIKQELHEVKEDVKEIKEELRQVKEGT